MNHQANTVSPTTASVGNVELIDGHQYRAADGRIHTLELITDAGDLSSIFQNLMKAAMLGLINFEVPQAQPKFFASDLDGEYGTPFYMDFRRGLLGITDRGNVLGDEMELVEDITDAKDAPETEVSTTDPTEILAKPGVKTFPLRLPLVEGRTYVTREGLVIGPLNDPHDGQEGLRGRIQSGNAFDVRYFITETGRHLYGEGRFDIIAEAEPHKEEASKVEESLPKKDIFKNLKAGEKFTHREGAGTVFIRTDQKLTGYWRDDIGVTRDSEGHALWASPDAVVFRVTEETPSAPFTPVEPVAPVRRSGGCF